MTVYVVMGVSGSGKSTVGIALANRLMCPFYDADAYHPEENVVKMASGQPLNDEDRAPWLANLRDLLNEHVIEEETAVLAYLHWKGWENCSIPLPSYNSD